MYYIFRVMPVNLLSTVKEAFYDFLKIKGGEHRFSDTEVRANHLLLCLHLEKLV